MFSTIALLLLIGSKTFWQSRKINYPSGKILSLGLFLVAVGILTYTIRDILTQFKLYEAELIIGKVGTLAHALGGLLVLRFFIQKFAPENIKKICFFVCLTLIIIVLIGLMIFPLVSETMQAPFEPFSYEIRRHTPEGMSAGLIIFIFIFTPLLLAGIIFYNTIKVEEKNLKTKAFLYGMGFLFLFIPAAVCLFISPIYARWGYLLGAIFIYKAFNIKI